MRRRHAYAATDNIILDFQADGHLMGEEFSTRTAPKLRIDVRGTDKIAQIDLIRNNEFLLTRKPNTETFTLDYSDTAAPRRENYYYVRVMQQDGNLAWSSPIWIKVE